MHRHAVIQPLQYSPSPGIWAEQLFLQCGITRAFSNKMLGAGVTGLGTDIRVVLATGLHPSYANACLDSQVVFLLVPGFFLLLLQCLWF